MFGHWGIYRKGRIMQPYLLIQAESQILVSFFRRVENNLIRQNSNFCFAYVKSETLANIQVQIKYRWLKSEKSMLEKRELIIDGIEVLGNGCDRLPMGGEEERPATKSRSRTQMSGIQRTSKMETDAIPGSWSKESLLQEMLSEPGLN